MPATPASLLVALAALAVGVSSMPSYAGDYARKCIMSLGQSQDEIGQIFLRGQLDEATDLSTKYALCFLRSYEVVNDGGRVSRRQLADLMGALFTRGLPDAREEAEEAADTCFAEVGHLPDMGAGERARALFNCILSNRPTVRSVRAAIRRLDAFSAACLRAHGKSAADLQAAGPPGPQVDVAVDAFPTVWLQCVLLPPGVTPTAKERQELVDFFPAAEARDIARADRLLTQAKGLGRCPDQATTESLRPGLEDRVRYIYDCIRGE